MRTRLLTEEDKKIKEKIRQRNMESIGQYPGKKRKAKCQFCGRIFVSRWGRRTHQLKMRYKEGPNIEAYLRRWE